ncbi:hypothetical protein N9N28_18280 [Rubripirellula amarantea]|nr:hypothetical protein [Rubripirellula amarantea]
MNHPKSMRLCVCLPVYNDWESVSELIAEMVQVDGVVRIVVIDDGSTRLPNVDDLMLFAERRVSNLFR